MSFPAALPPRRSATGSPTSGGSRNSGVSRRRLEPQIPRPPTRADVAGIAGAGVGAGELGRQTRRVIAASCHDCFLAVSSRAGAVLSVAVTGTRFDPPSRPLTSGVQLIHGTEPPSGRPTMDIFCATTRTPTSSQRWSRPSLRSGQVSTAHVGKAAAGQARGLAEAAGYGQRARPESRAASGLFGELSVLRDLLLPEAGTAAVLGWTGPTPASGLPVPGASRSRSRQSGNNAEIVGSRTKAARLPPGRSTVPGHARAGRQAGRPGLTLPELVGDLREGAALGIQPSSSSGSTWAATWKPRPTCTAIAATPYASAVHSVGGKFPRITERDLPDGVRRLLHTGPPRSTGFQPASPK